MTGSILNAIKKPLLGNDVEKHFDDQIIMEINAVFMVLNQLHVGPATGYFITDENQTWEEFLPDEEVRKELGALPTYMYQKVRLIFDPPTSSFVIDSISRQIAEFEWRLKTEAEGDKYVNG